MVSRIINYWLEEGFVVSTKNTNEVTQEKSLIPTIKNENGIIRTPKPLFTSFLEKSKLDPDFLPQNLETIKNKFLHAANINFDNYVSQIDKNAKGQEIEDLELEQIHIDYDRKNIFLSRVMFNLFEMPDSSVAKGSLQYPKVLEKNEFYQRALERHQKFPEDFREKCLQTDFIDSIEKQIETIPMIIKNKSCMVNNYVMTRHYDRQEMKIKPPPKTFKEFCRAKIKFHDYDDFLENIENSPDILFRFKEALYVTEKTLNYNTHQKSILEYNGCKTDVQTNELSVHGNAEELIDEKKSEIVEHFDIEFHLRFQADKMKNDYLVTCMEFSPINQSIFVVGYGVSRLDEMDHNIRGMVLSWNIHKCGYPEKIYHTDEIVTCLEFSRNEPHLVAVGMRYGLIAIVDLQTSDLFPSVNNYSSKVKPSGTIKSVRWVRKKYAMGKEMEVLLSVSIDGIICCWSYGRILDGHIIRTIKRGGNTAEEQRMVLATDAAGMCMQIKPHNSETFIVGTIEGQTLQADINDPESYTYSYNCHNGPLYDLQWSPIVPDVFMTCGTDRFVHIWQVGNTKPSKSLPLEDVVLKVAWSCVKSTLFAAMCAKIILLFDLSINLHKQVAEFSSSNGLTFRSIAFCPKNNWFLVGQSDGATELHEIVDIPSLKNNQEEALRNIFLSD